MKTVNEIREEFLQFFAQKKHKILPSSSLIPYDDPSLLFVNAGMVPFKEFFTGKGKPESKSIATCQKCIRAGGKHNDLENVGYTYRHHTFFEMLGNFSFGAYFKEEAIQYAWSFLTEKLNIEPNRLRVTVHSSDEEAYQIWKNIISESKILRIDNEDNFWSMGKTGPCGPCSEIFYDYGEDSKLVGEWKLDAEGKDLFADRFVEIWNLVFMQYNSDGKNMHKLPNPAIDTGMGLERIASILQNTYDNYNIDIFKDIILHLENIIGKSDNIFAYRIVADHIRSICFLIADGILPSQTGRGYVLRRIMRRAILQVNRLNYKKPLLAGLAKFLIQNMGKFYQELVRAEELITETCNSEELLFLKTLDIGLKVFDKNSKNLQHNSGAFAFKLYDTYGFPLDLTRDLFRENNIDLDEQQFQDEMLQQKERARANAKFETQHNDNGALLKLITPYPQTEFLGYKTLSLPIGNNNSSATILYSGYQDGKSDHYIIILDKTIFYPESGGQEADYGYIYNDTTKMEVYQVKKFNNGVIVHFCYATESSCGFVVNQYVNLSVDQNRRRKLSINHTATHILHRVLKNVLGEHVIQKGSLVAEDKLRFDFNYNTKLEDNIISEIETRVRKIIYSKMQVSASYMNLDEAIKSGAEALFGEKYDNHVRVLEIGQDPEQIFSTELCGGTHVQDTNEISLFKIISEASVSAGIRRIEAITSIEELEKYYDNKVEQLQVKNSALGENNKSLQKDLLNLNNKLLELGIQEQKIANITCLYNSVNGIDLNNLRNFVIQLLAKNIRNTIIVILYEYNQKNNVIIGVSDDINKEYPAKELIKTYISKGGGSQKLAQGTTNNDFSNTSSIIESLNKTLTSK